MAGKIIGGTSLIGKELHTLEGLGIRPNRCLYLQKNKLSTFEHYGVQPNVQSLFVQDNCIRSFFGLDAQPKLENIYLDKNPITRTHAHSYRLMCLLAVGPSLRKIDDELITNLERYQAQRLGPTAAQAIRLGYLLESSDLSPEEVEQIYQEQLAIHIDKFRNTISSSPHLLPSPKPIRPASPSMLSRPSCLSIHPPSFFLPIPYLPSPSPLPPLSLSSLSPLSPFTLSPSTLFPSLPSPLSTSPSHLPLPSPSILALTESSIPITCTPPKPTTS